MPQDWCSKAAQNRAKKGQQGSIPRTVKESGRGTLVGYLYIKKGYLLQLIVVTEELEN